MREWTDKQTGRTVRQLTHLPGGAHLDYFRFPRQLPGGAVQAIGETEVGNLLSIDAESGTVCALPIRVGGCLRLRETDGRLWYRTADPREIWAVDLPDGEPKAVTRVPEEVPGQIADISCDGRTVVLREVTQDLNATPVPTTKDVDALWRYFARPRRVRLRAFDIASGAVTAVGGSDELGFDHLDTSPTDPGLLRYCQDMFDGYGQRIWSVRLDGSDLKAIRPQERGEVVTHEFWWSDGKHIGYTYLDRRRDTTLHDLPWSEYAPTPTQLGIADASGKEVYLSDPLNCYHTHLFVSPDGRWVCGEGTDGHSFVYAAPFSRQECRVAFAELATVHTPYVPFRGQMVNCGFTADNRWLLYNDTVAGVLQICAVRVTG
jgi:hypothetical protein